MRSWEIYVTFIILEKTKKNRISLSWTKSYISVKSVNFYLLVSVHLEQYVKRSVLYKKQKSSIQILNMRLIKSGFKTFGNVIHCYVTKEVYTSIIQARYVTLKIVHSISRYRHDIRNIDMKCRYEKYI